MTIQIATSLGRITISEEVIEALAGAAALECYGLVGMASQKVIKDGLVDLLKRDNLGKGIVVRKEDDGLNIDLYVIVSYGTKISEVAYNVQSKVRYTLNKLIGLNIKSINVYIQGVRLN